MDLLEDIKNILTDSQDFIESQSFYFVNHKCEKTGKTIKVQLDYKLSCDLNDSIVKFGQCSECKTCFYHKDFESRTF